VSSPVSDSDKFKALNVQLGSVRLNVVCTLGLITLLVDMFNKIRENIDLIKGRLLATKAAQNSSRF
jgi:hypothetical protein